MGLSKVDLEKAIEKGEQEGGEVEFKRSLDKSIHLVENRKNSLVGQMKHRILSGNGTAQYVIGIDDDGDISGLNHGEFSETVDVLAALASEIDARIKEVDKWEVEDSKKVGLVEITDSSENISTDHILVGTAGHVDHGKSTLISSLVRGEPDDGEGLIREEELDVLEHEIQRGLSADLSYTVYGFKGNEPLRIGREDDYDKASVVRDSDRLVSFVDTVGHKPWLGTTMRGLVGQRLDYGLLVVAANEGVTETTKEHLGVLLAMDLPIIVSLTKTDLVNEEEIKEVEEDVKEVLNSVGNIGVLESNTGIGTCISKLKESVDKNEYNTTPIVRTSAVEMDGMDKLDKIFQSIPKVQYIEDDEFKMYIDKTYTVEGVGTVISGTVKSGRIEKGDKLIVGPDVSGEYHETIAQSLEIHYHRVDEAKTGQIVSISVSNLDEKDIRRGMIIKKNNDESPPTASNRFKANIMVLNHPTSVTTGYEPVIHLETVSETARIEADSRLLPGEKGEVTMEFKFNPYYLEEGQKFVFREGKAKGIGTIEKVL